MVCRDGCHTTKDRSNVEHGVCCVSIVVPPLLNAALASRGPLGGRDVGEIIAHPKIVVGCLGFRLFPGGVSLDLAGHAIHASNMSAYLQLLQGH